MPEERTLLGGLWAAGHKKLNGQIKFGDKILPQLDVCRVAVWPKEMPDLLRFTGDEKWTYEQHVEATPNQKDLLCVLFEPPGNARGIGFQRGSMWEPTLNEFVEFVKPYLETWGLWGIELGNELGVVAQGAERLSRWRFMLDLAEWFAPWLRENYPDVKLVMGGLHGIEVWLDEGEYGASFNAYCVDNGSALLRERALLDLHTFAYRFWDVPQRVAEIRGKGWDCIFGEEFREDRPSRVTTFQRSSEVVQVAHDLGIPLVCVFTDFEREDWGHSAPRSKTEFLAVTGPNGNVRKGDPGEPDHLAELLRCAEIVRGEAPVPVPGGWEEGFEAFLRSQPPDRAISIGRSGRGNNLSLVAEWFKGGTKGSRNVSSVLQARRVLEGL